MKTIKPEIEKCNGQLEECKNCINCNCANVVEGLKKAREEAYQKTLFGKIKKLLSFEGKGKKIYKIIFNTFSYIENHSYVKITIIVLYVLASIFCFVTKQAPWNKLNIAAGEDYKASYINGEYLIETEKEEVSISIAVTKEVNDIYVIENPKSENETMETYQITEKLIVNVKEDTPYTLGVNYVDGTSEEINFKKK